MLGFSLVKTEGGISLDVQPTLAVIDNYKEGYFELSLRDGSKARVFVGLIMQEQGGQVPHVHVQVNLYLRPGQSLSGCPSVSFDKNGGKLLEFYSYNGSENSITFAGVVHY